MIPAPANQTVSGRQHGRPDPEISGIVGRRHTSNAAYRLGLKMGGEAARPTPPDFTPAFATHWGRIAPFALSSAAEFRPAPPPAVGSAQARAEMAEVRAIGGAKSSTRSPERSEISRFWYEDSMQGWNRIAREVAAVRPLDAWENARLLNE